MTDFKQTPLLQTISDVVCTQCGCICDDLSLSIDESAIVAVEKGCQIAESWFTQQNRPVAAEFKLRGTTIPFNEAIQEARSILAQSQNPLITGLSSSSIAGQRAACALADQLGANIDPSASEIAHAAMLSFQQVGEATSSLGEVRNRSDFIIFWGTDPVTTHPRLLDRLQAGRGLADESTPYIVVIDSTRTATAEIADLFLQVKSEEQLNAIWLLRGLMKGIEPVETEVGGVEFDVWRDLANRMMGSHYGAVFYGSGLNAGDVPHLSVAALSRLVADLHQHTRFVIQKTRDGAGTGSAENVLSWQTGYSNAVNLGRGFPRSNPGEFSANQLLERSEVDVALIVGHESFANLSSEALNRLKQIPTIVLAAPDAALPIEPTLRFATGHYGVHYSGTAYRMDDWPLPLRKWKETELPSDEEILLAFSAADTFA